MPRNLYLDNIQQLLIDTKSRLILAADSGNIAEIARLADQVSSLSRLFEAAS